MMSAATEAAAMDDPKERMRTMLEELCDDIPKFSFWDKTALCAARTRAEGGGGRR